MRDFEKAEIMARERDGLRQEIVSLGTAMHKSFFAFFTVMVAILMMYFGKEIVDEHNRAVLILIFSQVEILFGFFMMSLLACQNVHIGYISALEDKINTLAGDNINIWDSRITPKYLARPGSAFFATCFMQVLGFLLVFVVLIYFCYAIVDHAFWCVMFAVEVALVLVVGGWAMWDMKRVARFAKVTLREKRK